MKEAGGIPSFLVILSMLLHTSQGLVTHLYSFSLERVYCDCIRLHADQTFLGRLAGKEDLLKRKTSWS